MLKEYQTIEEYQTIDMKAYSIANKRIEFIDLAKGVCILLVVVGHCGVGIPIPGLNMMRMPLYFILSGLFF